MGSSAEAVLRRLHDEHASALWGYCLQLTGHDYARAEDVVQETLIRALNHHQRLDESQGSVRGWLFTVARNIVIDQWRSQRSRREVSVDEVPDVATGAEEVDHLVQAWVVADALNSLTDAHREVLVECFYRGASVAEAARVLGVPEGTVKSRTHYALKALGLALQERGVRP